MSKRAYLKQIRVEWKSKGLCTDCGSNPAINNKIRCVSCTTKHADNNRRYALRHKARIRSKHIELKIEVFTKYGGTICNCCRESNLKFLSIDHVHNNGNIHRRTIGQKTEICKWLKKNNYPDGFQVLCYNCNFGKNVNGGICPHLEGD